MNSEKQEDLVDRLARRIEKDAKERKPIVGRGPERYIYATHTGVPFWLHELLAEAGVNHVQMVELGGRGVLTEAGWVSIDELREIADDD